MVDPRQGVLPGFEADESAGVIPSSEPVLDAPVFVAELLPGLILVVRLQLYTEATGDEGGSRVKAPSLSRH